MNTFVIAEIGINHNNSLDNCFTLISAAAEAGCQAAKFQMFSAAQLYPKSAGQLDWQDGTKKYSYNIFDAVKGFELPLQWIDPLMSYCHEKKIGFMSSVFDRHGLEYLVKKGIKRIKLSSYTITNIPLIKAVAETGLPIIMSTGGATLAETEKAVEIVTRIHNKLALLHCSIQYPTELTDCNMGVLKTLQFAFPGIKTGYSDHTAEVSAAPVQSVYLGGSIVEKHITLDKTMKGPDHFFALEPYELKIMTNAIQKAETDVARGEFCIDDRIFGSSAKMCHDNETYLRNFCYMTLFASRDITGGEIIKPEDIAILRPGKKERGLEPEFLYLFEKKSVVAKKDIQCEDPITWDVII
ncbi:MAG: N-acetylneuraminate synthase family protein [bacterium]